MKIKKLICLISLMLALILTFSGCDFVLFASVDSLMHPPGSYNQNEELQNAFKAVVGEDFTLEYPLYGEYRSPFVFYDTDGDGQDEAVVFYTLKKDDAAVKMALFDIADGQWKCIADVKGAGNSVNKVAFDDIYNDGTAQILVSWGFYDSKASNVLTVYGMTADENGVNNFQPILSEPYSFMKILDVDEKDKDEILLITSISAGGKTENFANIYAMRPDGSYALATTMLLDSTVSEYTSVKAEPSKGSKPYRVFIDARKGENSMVTEVLSWNSESNVITSPLYNPQTKSVEKTVRNSIIESRDIDGDGLIEIPVQPRVQVYVQPAGAADEVFNLNRQYAAFLVEWCGLSENNELVRKKYSAVNTPDAYMIDFPADWLGKITVSMDIEKRKLNFSKLNSAGNAAGSPVFDVITLAAGEWETNPPEGYSHIFTNQNLVYAVKIYDSAASLKISATDVKKMFTLL